MKIKSVKILSLIVCLVLVVILFCSCDVKSLISGKTSSTVEPVAVSLKTDLNDASVSFTYGELKGVIAADKLANLFEDFDEKEDSSEVSLSYYDIVARFGKDKDELEKVMNLLTEDEKNSFTKNSQQVLDYFVSHINQVKVLKPITRHEESFSIDKKTISFTQNGNESDKRIKTAAEYYSDFVVKGINNTFDENEKDDKNKTNSGDELTNVLYLFGSDVATTLTSDDVVSVISSLSTQTNNNSDNEKVVTEITRTIEIILKDDANSVLKAFSPKDKTSILNEMKKSSEYFTVEDYNIKYNACKITATFNAATDDILSVSYDKNMIINTQVTGTGSLSDIGKQNLTFNCNDNMYYQFGWEAEAK